MQLFGVNLTGNIYMLGAVMVTDPPYMYTLPKIGNFLKIQGNGYFHSLGPGLWVSKPVWQLHHQQIRAYGSDCSSNCSLEHSFIWVAEVHCSPWMKIRQSQNTPYVCWYPYHSSRGIFSQIVIKLAGGWKRKPFLSTKVKFTTTIDVCEKTCCLFLNHYRILQ